MILSLLGIGATNEMYFLKLKDSYKKIRDTPTGQRT